MKIVDITSFFSSACGGIKTYYREKARRLADRDIECHFIVPGRDRESLPYERAVLHAIPGPPLLGSAHYRRFGDLRALGQTLEAIGPDLIEVGSHYMLPSLLRSITAKLPRRPQVVGFYHADYPETYVGPALRRTPRLRRHAENAAWGLVRYQHERYAMTLVGSQFIAQKLRANGVPRVRWVGLGVDAEQFHPTATEMPRHELVVAYAGRFSKEKEVSVLLEAFDEVHACTGARLVLAGDGALLPLIQTHAQRRSFVQLLGYLDGAGVARLLATADVVVAPGGHESFSLAAAEAMACATPVVGADRGGNRELVLASGGGVTFSTGDPLALARRIIELLMAPRCARLELGRRGRRHVVSELTWDRVCDRLASAYAEVVAAAA